MDRVYDYFLCVPQGRPGCSLTQRPSHHSAPGIHHRGGAEVSTVRLYVVDGLCSESRFTVLQYRKTTKYSNRVCFVKIYIFFFCKVVLKKMEKDLSKL